jgi:organic hydroperoxide reductase OsmC/OhrA
MNISNEKVTVSAHFHEQGSVLKGDAEGFCDRFEVEIHVDSDANQEDVETLIRLARRLCFTEKALTGEVQVVVTQFINGEPVQVLP